MQWVLFIGTSVSYVISTELKTLKSFFCVTEGFHMRKYASAATEYEEARRSLTPMHQTPTPKQTLASFLACLLACLWKYRY